MFNVNFRNIMESNNKYQGESVMEIIPPDVKRSLLHEDFPSLQMCVAGHGWSFSTDNRTPKNPSVVGPVCQMIP